MQLIDFIDACDINSKTEIEVFELLCYYLMKEEGKMSFSVKKMLDMYKDAGIPVPERKALEKEAKKYQHFRPHGIEGTLKFASGAVGALEKTYGHLWSGGAARVASSPVRAAVPAGVQLPDFADACKLSEKNEAERFELLCYYQARENGARTFSIRGMADVYTGAGLETPDRSAVEKQVRKHGSFVSKGIDGSLEFAPGVLGSLDSTYGYLWDAPAAQTHPAAQAAPVAKSVPSAAANVEVLSEERFCGKRDGLDRLIVQVNSTYRDGAFDACAAVMRRLIEAALILSFQANGIENEIRGNGNDYIKFEDIVKKAAGSSVLALSQKGIDISMVSRIGDYSGKGPMYTFGANDINAVRTGYRNILETLYEVAKLL